MAERNVHYYAMEALLNKYYGSLMNLQEVIAVTVELDLTHVDIVEANDIVEGMQQVLKTGVAPNAMKTKISNPHEHIVIYLRNLNERHRLEPLLPQEIKGSTVFREWDFAED